MVLLATVTNLVIASVRAEDNSKNPLPAPKLPATPYTYAAVNFPPHFRARQPRFGSLLDADNTPAGNPITDAGATLGRVLFYDVRLSANNTISCSSCHQQKHGFSDPKRFSRGLHGKLTSRHSMGLTNSRFYSSGRFFWDERAATLEDQVLMPIQDEVEMGMDLDTLEKKLRTVDFYPPLFEAAFSSPEINHHRISRALAQFVRSLGSYQSKYDRAFAIGRDGVPNFQKVFNEQEIRGLQLFFRGLGPRGGRSARCGRCHGTHGQISRTAQNNGLDLNTDKDNGAGGGRFKAPSLRNVAVRAPYMHDGRFKTLRQVIEHYNSGVQNHANLDRALSERRGRGPDRGVRNQFGQRGNNQNSRPQRLNLSQIEIDALVAFLNTLTDTKFLNDPRFSDPFNTSKKRTVVRKRRVASRNSRQNPDRAANREKLAREALKKARAATEPRIQTAKLKLIVRQFGETEAAKTAQSILDRIAD